MSLKNQKKKIEETRSEKISAEQNEAITSSENIEKKSTTPTIEDKTKGNTPKKEVKNSDVRTDENIIENKVESKDKSDQKKSNKSENDDLTKKKEKE